MDTKKAVKWHNNCCEWLNGQPVVTQPRNAFFKLMYSFCLICTPFNISEFNLKSRILLHEFLRKLINMRFFFNL